MNPFFDPDNIKIVFFDIDGTLLNFGAAAITPRVNEALLALQKRGVKLFIATGRAPYEVPKFPDVSFDGIISFNGGYCFDQTGIIHSVTIEKDDMRTVIANAKALGYPALLATETRMGSNFFHQDLYDYMQISRNDCHVTPDYEALQEEDVYQMMIGIHKEEEHLLLPGTRHVKIARWWDRAVDIIPDTCGKRFAIEAILAHYGYTKEQAMAFGDGGNDLDMIAYVGVGVAMGNAVDAVKAAADYITDPCSEDGVYTALRHFRMLT